MKDIPRNVLDAIHNHNNTSLSRMGKKGGLARARQREFDKFCEKEFQAQQALEFYNRQRETNEDIYPVD